MKRVVQKQRKGRLWFSLILISSFDTEVYGLYIYINIYIYIYVYTCVHYSMLFIYWLIFLFSANTFNDDVMIIMIFFSDECDNEPFRSI